MRREPRSAVIADPPAPEISSAVAIGAASRTTARTIAAPVCDWAPSWRETLPTWRATVAPNAIATRITGTIDTLTMNHDDLQELPDGPRPLEEHAERVEREREHVARLARAARDLPADRAGPSTRSCAWFF